ncbi:hypothetical protein Pmani_031236 [Petrolisthes manimaculis]|uniref:Uncharacterized protein n=1 Tax=Petrolisthes manimaculis TaxID=1843537 RepID=A0AAE1NU38_9EUCA|nr:hypothetical protein Pmani_031236 [Petrolisthes manimaculis]
MSHDTNSYIATTNKWRRDEEVEKRGREAGEDELKKSSIQEVKVQGEEDSLYQYQEEEEEEKKMWKTEEENKISRNTSRHANEN